MSKEAPGERIVDQVILSCQQNQPKTNFPIRVFTQDEYLGRNKNIVSQQIIKEEQIIKVPKKRKKKTVNIENKKRAKTLDSRGQLTRAELLGGIVDKIKEVKNSHKVEIKNEQLHLTENIDKIEYLIKETSQGSNLRNEKKEKEDEMLKELIRQIGQINKEIQQREEIAPRKQSAINSVCSQNTRTYPQNTKSQLISVKFPSTPGGAYRYKPQEEKLITSPKYAFTPKIQTAPNTVSGVFRPVSQRPLQIKQKRQKQIRPLIKETYYRVDPKRQSQVSNPNDQTKSAPKVKFSYAEPKYQNLSPYKTVLFTKGPEFPKPKKDIQVTEKKDKAQQRFSEYGCCWKCGRGCPCQRIKIHK